MDWQEEIAGELPVHILSFNCDKLLPEGGVHAWAGGDKWIPMRGA